MRWLNAARLLILCLVASVVPTAWAETAPPPSCEQSCRAGQFDCERAVVQCLIDADQTRRAVQLAKQHLSQRPHESEYARLLARAYMAQGNTFWALRTLSGLQQKAPPDCLARSMVAWIHIQQALFERAEEVLDSEGCPRRPPDRARWALYRAFVAHARGQVLVVRAELSKVEATGVVYPDDLALWQHLVALVRPRGRTPFRVHADLSYGYTSDVRAGLPIVPLPKGEPSSMLRVRLRGQAVWPSDWTVRPGIEGSLRGELYENFNDEVDVSQLNQLDLSVRPGLVAEWAVVTAALGYRGSLFMVQASDPVESASPWVLTEGHRGEVDLILPHGLTAIAGFGHRTIAWRGRTRWEFDGGGGWAFDFDNGHSLLAAVSGRFHLARSAVYLRAGGQLALSWRFPLTHRFSGRMRLSQGLDYFPNSPEGGGIYSLLEAQAEVWFNIWRGVQAGVGYELAWAAGTTEALAMFTAHRVMPTLRWDWSWDPTAPRLSRSGDLVGLDYGLRSSGAQGHKDRVQDLLRHDSVSQQASSCGAR